MRHSRRHIGLLTVIAVLFTWVTNAPRLAEAKLPYAKSVRIGFDGKYKVGHWTPVSVTLVGGHRPDSVQLELIVLDGDGVRTKFAPVESPAIQLPAETETSVLGYVKFGRVNSGLTVTLRGSDGAVVTSREFSSSDLPHAALATNELVVTAGQSIGVEDAISSRRRSGSDQQELLTSLIQRAADLPDRWYGYEGVDTLIVTTSQPEFVDQLSSQQFEALEQWVRLGGRLILCVGARGQQMLGPGGRWTSFAPGRFAGVVAQRSTRGFETYAAATQRLDAVGGTRAADFHLDMTLLQDVRVLPEAYEGTGPYDRPSIVRFPLGFGQVTFVAVDLDQAPFTQWQGRPRLVAKILQGQSDRRDESAVEQRSGQVMHVGYEDIVGQLRSALDQFDGVTLVWFSWVAGLLVLYIALIGPADYFFLKNIVGRMQWTWVTFPVVVVLFCTLAYLLSDVWKGNRLRINQVDLVDVDVDGSLIRGTTWANVYSPRTDSFNLSLDTHSSLQEPASVLLSWQGLPGEGLGGMNTRATAAEFNVPYAIASEPCTSGGSHAAIGNMPIQVSSTKTLAARWWGKAELAYESRLTVKPDGVLTGELTNPLPVELTDGMLAHNDWAYLIQGSFAPGQTIRIDEQTSLRRLDWRLTRRTVVDTKDVSTPWDQSSTDVPRILEIMMFHRAARGQAYTELSHRYQAYVDLSDHLRMGRAILMGRAESRAADLVRDGQPMADNYDRHWTFYRVVLPVENESPSVN
jgi:hypothetical protein